MYTIVAKICNRHGWISASEFLEHNDSFLGIQYLSYRDVNPRFSNTEVVHSDYYTPKDLSEVIVYFLTEFKDKRNILIFTESTEEENKELISAMKVLNIGKEESSSKNVCIIICNDSKEDYKMTN